MNSCLDCGKRIQNHNKRCKKCNNKFQFGKNNGHYKNGITLKKYYCKNCNKRISLFSALYGTKRCSKCSHKNVVWHRHHLYLKMFKTDKIIILKSSKHTMLHRKVYEYLLETQGKIAIRKYLKWFIKKYGLKQKLPFVGKVVC